MPRNFSPKPRVDVMDSFSEMDSVTQVEKCGPGITVLYSRRDGNYGYANLTQEAGWYLDRIHTREGGDIAIVMPITEVPE